MTNTDEITDKLKPAEKREYTRLLSVVRSGLDGFMEAGRALQVIRDKRLYRDQFGSFEEFCRAEFKLSKPHAIRLIGAYNAVQGLMEGGSTKLLPSSERVARELSAVPEDMRSRVWERAQELAGPDKEPDYNVVRAAVFEVLPPDKKSRSEELEFLSKLRAAERNLLAANELVTAEIDSTPESEKMTLDLLGSIWRTVNTIKKEIAAEKDKS